VFNSDALYKSAYLLTYLLTHLFTLVSSFLADRTNGHTYATVLRPSVVCLILYGMYFGSTVRPRAKVTIDSP